MEEQGVKTKLLQIFHSDFFELPFLLLWTVVDIICPISYSQWLWGFCEVRDVNILWKYVVLFQMQGEIAMTDDINTIK